MYALTLWERYRKSGLEAPDNLLGQRIAIHAGQKIDGAGIVRAMEILRKGAVAYAHDAQELCGEPGVIVGTVIVLGWVSRQLGLTDWSPNLTQRTAYYYVNSNWFEGLYGWCLAAPKLLREPIPCKGFQKLWNVEGDIEEEIYAQLKDNP